MAYEASLQDNRPEGAHESRLKQLRANNWLWNSAMSFAEKKAAEKAAKEAIAKERAKAKQEKYNMQIESVRALKGSGVSNQVIAESLKTPFRSCRRIINKSHTAFCN